MALIPSDVESAAAALRDGTCSSVELTEACLARADAFDELVGTYLARFDESALAAAATADAELAAGIDRGPMQGIPIGMKDILAMSEGPTTANSLVLDPAWGAGKEGPVVRRLKDAGAVITGKVVDERVRHRFARRVEAVPDPAQPVEPDDDTGRLERRHRQRDRGRVLPRRHRHRHRREHPHPGRVQRHERAHAHVRARARSRGASRWASPSTTSARWRTARGTARRCCR